MPAWLKRSRQATVSSREELLRSTRWNIRSVSWNNRGYSTRDEGRNASWMACNEWMLQSWKEPISKPEPSLRSKGSCIRLQRPGWSWKTRIMSCLWELKPHGLRATVNLSSYRRLDRLVETLIGLFVLQRPHHRRHVSIGLC